MGDVKIVRYVGTGIRCKWLGDMGCMVLDVDIMDW